MEQSTEESPDTTEDLSSTEQLTAASRISGRESATETIPPTSVGKGEKSEVRAHSCVW